jgi:hypothetical protein
MDAFMNEFNLYHMTNIVSEQTMNPMKRAALMLGFIEGLNIKDWVKHWTNWTLNQINTGRPSMDEYNRDQGSQGFTNAILDTGTRERAEDKLCYLSFIPNEVKTFFLQLESLAAETTYNLDAQPTLSLLASKLPFKMVDHIYKVVRPTDFNQWANTICQYHQTTSQSKTLEGFMRIILDKHSPSRKALLLNNLLKSSESRCQLQTLMPWILGQTDLILSNSRRTELSRDKHALQHPLLLNLIQRSSIKKGNAISATDKATL